MARGEISGRDQSDRDWDPQDAWYGDDWQDGGSYQQYDDWQDQRLEYDDDEMRSLRQPQLLSSVRLMQRDGKQKLRLPATDKLVGTSSSPHSVGIVVSTRGLTDNRKQKSAAQALARCSRMSGCPGRTRALASSTSRICCPTSRSLWYSHRFQVSHFSIICLTATVALPKPRLPTRRQHHLSFHCYQCPLCPSCFLSQV